MHYLYYISERKFYARTHVKIMRHWKTTLTQSLKVLGNAWNGYNFVSIY